ncbi:MAG: acryloyl-CoA reductase [Chloroflexi bacterium]|nr:acryloyl-CoA reductase [Chloroflexota bacterium]
MAGIPDGFDAFVAEVDGDRVLRGVRRLAPGDLPPGEVTIRVAWSGVNYKDALATVADGKVARISPLVPGIDIVGTVAASDDPAVVVGEEVVAHGYEIGVSRHGGFAAYARVPAGWVVPLPSGLSARDAAAVGTAGYTAADSVAALEARGLAPGDGPVLVTGASGGVGGVAVRILLARGHETWAMTGKPAAADRLRALGVAGVVGREEAAAGEGRALGPERWAGAVDCVGAATLPYILRTLRRDAAVAASGNASGPALATTVFPFILRGVALLGIDSSQVPIANRRALWGRIAADLRPVGLGDDTTEFGLDGLPDALDAVLAGRAEGRWLVRVGG